MSLSKLNLLPLCGYVSDGPNVRTFLEHTGVRYLCTLGCRTLFAFFEYSIDVDKVVSGTQVRQNVG